MEFTEEELRIIYLWYLDSLNEGFHYPGGDALAERIDAHLEPQETTEGNQ